MRRTLFVIAVLTALVPPVGSRASVPVALFGEVSGYSTGTAIHSGVLETGSTRRTDVEVAFSGANVNPTGLGAALVNEMKQAFSGLPRRVTRAPGETQASRSAWPPPCRTWRTPTRSTPAVSPRGSLLPSPA